MGEQMNKKLKKRLMRILFGAILFIIAVLINRVFGNIAEWIRLLLFLSAYAVIGGDVVKRAVLNISKGQVFDENFLMLVATVGAFAVREYPEAVAVMLFYQVGEWFQAYAVNKSRKSIKELMDIRPDYANLIKDGLETKVEPEEVRLDDVILIKPGERIPLDGIILKGTSTIDTKALTGESIPRDAAVGEDVISGCINLTGVLEVQVTKEFTQSTVTRILELVENASEKKAETEFFITKFARYYTPIVVALAALLAIVPPLIQGGNWSMWIYRALTFLVISCPCALVISIPLSFFGGIGGAGKAGILIKGSNYLEALAEAEIVVMDKTGTLTKGIFTVTSIVPAVGSDGMPLITKEELLRLTAHAESFSSHPISLSLMEAYGKKVNKETVQKVEELAGYGVHAVVDTRSLYLGNAALMKQQKVEFTEASEIGSIVYIAENNQYLGYIAIADVEKKDAKSCIQGLQAAGVKHIVMLTGDRKETADAIASKLGITEVFSELLPADKVEQVERLMHDKSQNGKLIFVGDGMNDAPVLARADIGIAMGGLGSDAAVEAADIVIMNDEPSKIVLAMEISKKTLKIVKQNIVFAIGIKVLVLFLASIGFASMWAAVFADVGVAFLAILNAMRAMNIKGLGSYPA